MSPKLSRNGPWNIVQKQGLEIEIYKISIKIPCNIEFFSKPIIPPGWIWDKKRTKLQPSIQVNISSGIQDPWFMDHKWKLTNLTNNFIEIEFRFEDKWIVKRVI